MPLRTVSILLVLALVVPMFAQGNSADDKIYDEVRRRLANDPDVKGAGLEVIVKAGAVTLRGRVHDVHAKDKAEKITKKVKGVTKVTNELRVFGQD
jgi:osmotically-inducible protein OsmY